LSSHVARIRCTAALIAQPTPNQPEGTIIGRPEVIVIVVILVSPCAEGRTTTRGVAHLPYAEGPHEARPSAICPETPFSSFPTFISPDRSLA
jgi:hypothetical protein